MLPTTNYSPGLHILLTLQVDEVQYLQDLNAFLNFTENLLVTFDLKKVGISSFTFDTNGYTAAICLMESHICIHTWPEFNQLTLDIYLCNYLKNNSGKVEEIASAYKAYFKAKVLNETKVNR